MTIRIKSYCDFLNEEVTFSVDEMDVQEKTRELLLTLDVAIVSEGAKFTKVEQMSSSTPGKTVMSDEQNLLTEFFSPFHFIKWEKLASDSSPISKAYIVKLTDFEKI